VHVEEALLGLVNCKESWTLKWMGDSTTSLQCKVGGCNETPISSNTTKTEFGLRATSSFKESIQNFQTLYYGFVIVFIMSQFFLKFIIKEFNCEKGANMV